MTGVVGAAGGLGGSGPLVVGAIYGWTGSYAHGLALLAAGALVAAACTAVAGRDVGGVVSDQPHG